MRFFLDTASIEDIEKWRSFGLVDGVTTNPALLAKHHGDPLEQLRAVAKAVAGPVSAQVTHRDTEQMVVQAIALSKIADNIVVKLPATLQGYASAQSLVRKGIKCNITLTFDPSQAVPFCRLPVEYISLIIGRVEDFGLSSVVLIEQLRDVRDRLGSSTQILAASIRNPHHMISAIRAGVDALTVPPTTWANIYGNPLSIKGEDEFLLAWRGLSSELRHSYDHIS